MKEYKEKQAAQKNNLGRKSYDTAIWAEFQKKLPWEKSKKEKALRDEQWRLIDVNGNGLLSLAEIDKGLKEII